MKKAVILYASVHHKNTEKVVNYIASAIDADVIDLLKNRNPSMKCPPKVRQYYEEELD